MTSALTPGVRVKEIFAVELVIDGVRYIETEWPADCRYEITTHITHPVQHPGKAGYMGLFTRQAKQSESAPTLFKDAKLGATLNEDGSVTPARAIDKVGPVSDALAKLDAAILYEGNVAGGVVPWPLARALLLDAVSGAIASSASSSTLTPLERYGLAVLESHRKDIGDLDGAFLQEKAEQCGLLYYVEVTEPCGDYCRCAEYDDFPQQCLRLKPEFEPKMAEHRLLEKETPYVGAQDRG